MINRRNSVVVLTIFAAIFVLSGCGGNGGKTVTIIFTSDVHGMVMPEEGRDSGTLARVATYVHEIREQEPNILLLDGGDTIQGNPLMYMHARRDSGRPNPIIEAMNLMRYDAMAVGNHDFNFGMDYLRSAEREALFPLLSANTVDAQTGEPVFPPYVVKTVAGLKVGILGMVTDGVPNWELPEHIRGLRFVEPAETARTFLPVLREQEKCDLVIVILHAGFPRTDEDGNYLEADRERSALAIAAMEGVDLLLTGHIHRLMEPREVGNTYAATCPPYGRGVIRIDLEVIRDGSNDLVIKHSGAYVEMTGDIALDEEISAAAKPMYDLTEAYLNTELLTLDEPLGADSERLTDTRLMDILQQAQLSATGADVSIASLLPWEGIAFEPGPLTVRDVFRFYPYENFLMTVELTGAQIREFLEWSARYYDGAEIDEAGRLVIETDSGVDPYNVDFIEGLRYRIDPTRPEGERVAELTHEGRPLDPQAVFSVAVNSYRYAGGGGYEMLKGARVLSTADLGVREVLIDFLRERGIAGIEASGNWYLSPDGKHYPVTAEHEH